MGSENIPVQSQTKKGNDLTLMTLAEVASLIKAGKISPVEVVEACLKRTEALQGKLNAYVYSMADEAKKAAKRAESEVRKSYKGPLHGIPVALKDLYYTKGIPTTGGSSLMVDFRPEFNGTIVQRLIDAGAIIMGKTNTHEWAFGPTTEESFFGPSRNPWNPKKITGGSSGGSAIAAATGMAYVAMGSDTGGSIRIPSALCGTIGFKPTYGLASLHGIIGLSFTLDTPGPLTRSVMDAALAMDAYAGPDPLDPCPGRLSGPVPKFAESLKGVDNLKGKVIAVPTNFFFEKTDYEVEKLVMKGVAAMKDLGAEVRRIEIPSLELVPEVSTVILFSEAAQYHKDRFAEFPDKYQPGVKARLEQGGAYKAVEYIDALKGREKIMADWERALTGIDGVVVPTCPIPAYDIGLPAPWNIQTRGKTEGGRAMLTHHTRLANTAGIPAISIPCGLSSDGLPVGLMIMGRRNDDAGVLRLGHAYEKHNPFPKPI
ncbi:MAG: glutamyl-tRNA(Gln) amidotransferase subunit [Deltaproteobacteria bacterium]|jgi:aspartyl-tRNA(Asn)/glutamyl-tRNA(Gln) amidotransferase subunit A|nr:glutamyl-tRNA(Gln) amidotransferase subunit [Deltaproteobacteria bacterium]